jgi:hypothetical protein
VANCKSCGAANPDGAKFCGNCGAPVTRPTPPPQPAAAAPSPIAPQPSRSALSGLLTVFLIIVLIGSIAGLLIPVLSGAAPYAAHRNAGGFLGVLLFTYILARVRKARQPWVWVLYAFLGLMLAYAFSGALRGYSDAKEQTRLGQSLVDAVASFDSSAASRMQGLADKQAMMKIVAPVLLRAMQRAPDTALLAFNAAQVELITPTSDNDVARCAAAVRGAGYSFDPANEQKQANYLQNVAALIRAAANNPVTPDVPTADDTGPLLLPLYDRVDPSGYRNDPAKLSKLSDKDQCQIYLNFQREILALAPADAARIFRFIMATRKP